MLCKKQNEITCTPPPDTLLCSSETMEICSGHLQGKTAWRIIIESRRSSAVDLNSDAKPVPCCYVASDAINDAWVARPISVLSRGFSCHSGRQCVWPLACENCVDK